MILTLIYLYSHIVWCPLLTCYKITYIQLGIRSKCCSAVCFGSYMILDLLSSLLIGCIISIPIIATYIWIYRDDGPTQTVLCIGLTASCFLVVASTVILRVFGKSLLTRIGLVENDRLVKMNGEWFLQFHEDENNVEVHL